MMSAMNLAWFIGVLALYLGAKQMPTNKEFFASTAYTTCIWCACIYDVLFGLSHWMFVMNYMTLAMRIRYSDSGKFQNHTAWLNIGYYGVGALNVCAPILRGAFAESNPTVANYFWLSAAILWVFTAAVMVAALAIISRSLDAETRVVVNCKEISLHISVFTIFALCSLGVSIVSLKIYPNPSSEEETRSLQAMAVNTVLYSLCGLILMYIFIKIKRDVKNSADKNAAEVLFDENNLSFVEKPEVLLSNQPSLNLEPET
jgi:hypothetical protein